MDDTAQNPTQSVQPADQQMPAAPVQSVLPQQSSPAQPQPFGVAQGQQQASTSAGGKEQEAVTVGGVQPSHPEVIVPEVVAEAGVTKETSTDHEIRLSPEQQTAGIEAAKEATPVVTEPTKVQLPGDYKEPSTFGLLHQHVQKAATWLWLLLFKVRQQDQRNAQGKQEKEEKEK